MEIEVLTWWQLIARAGSAARARALIKDQLWWRVWRNAYVERIHADVAATRLAAARAVLPAEVALSHRAALWALGVDVLDRAETLDVTAPRDHRLARRPGLRPHTAALPDEELVDHDGVLMVSAARAFVDVARMDSLVEAVAFGDAVLRSGAATLELLAECLDRAGGLRGVCRAREVMPHLEPRSESLMESRLRMKMVLGGLPRPQAQYDMYDDHGEHCGRGDLHLDGVIVEYDGREARLDKARFTKDRRRRSRISDLGFEIREFTSSDVYQRSDIAVCAEITRAAVQAAGRDRSRFRAGPDTLPPPKLRPLPTRAELKRPRAA